jgi:hypothetical protein
VVPAAGLILAALFMIEGDGLGDRPDRDRESTGGADPTRATT